MTAPKYRRYPVAPLLKALGDMTGNQVKQTLGVHQTTFVGWQKKPDIGIVEWDADRYAVALGKHPSEIWDDWFDIYSPIPPTKKVKQRT